LLRRHRRKIWKVFVVRVVVLFQLVNIIKQVNFRVAIAFVFHHVRAAACKVATERPLWKHCEKSNATITKLG
jgi:hypothetical protein